MKKEESIVKPEGRGPRIPGGHLIFMPFLPFPALISEIKKSAKRTINAKPGILFYLENKAVLYGPIGAAVSICTLENIRLLDVKQITLLSYCGSLTKNLRLGMVLVPESALSEEGTSRHYIRRKNHLFYADIKSVLKIKSYLEKNNLPFFTGSIVSTDAPYRETLSWMKKMQKKGAQAVDMEASAVLAFSEFYGIKAAGLFIVSDELSSGRWIDGLRQGSVAAATWKYFSPLILDDAN